MKLTDNFYLPEFTKSSTAIRKGIENIPKGVQIDNLVLLCKHVLQPTRDYYGKSITVNSGFRSLALNEALPGSKTSQHMFGMAADIDTEKDNADLFFYIRHNLPFDQLIWEYGDESNPDWVHVSFNDGNNRGQVLRCERINGRTVYAKMA